METILSKIKLKNEEDQLYVIPIYLDGKIAGFIEPITFQFKNYDPKLVSCLSKWRKNNPTAATGTFEVTDARTEKWLVNAILNNQNRILFIVMDSGRNKIGQLGFADISFEKGNADIDAVIRGESSQPGLMGHALETLIAWGKLHLQLSNIYLDCFNDNDHALKFYRKHGFTEIGRTALVKKEYPDEVKWEIDKELDPNQAERWYIRMKKTK